MVSSVLAPYLGKMVARKTFNTRANCGYHGSHCCTWESCVHKSEWSRLAFGNRSQRIKGANRLSETGDQVTVKYFCLCIPQSWMLWESLQSSQNFWCDRWLLTGDTNALSGRTFKLDIVHTTVESWQMPENDLVTSMALFC